MAPVITCANCHIQLDETWDGKPCPNCESLARNKTVELNDNIGLTDERQIDVSYAQPRPWDEKWREVQTGLSELENAYNDSNIDRVRHAVEHFFRACRELADWLEQAAGVPALVFVHSQQDLRICDGLVQTSKHYSRSGKDPITAEVGGVTSKSTGSSSARIDWSRPSGSQGSEDALDLARKCFAAWQPFLKQHGLLT